MTDARLGRLAPSQLLTTACRTWPSRRGSHTARGDRPEVKEHEMNLNDRQLHRIEAGLRRADPHLDVMFGIFGRLYQDQEIPGWEQVPQVPAPQNRLRRVGAWIVAVLAAAGEAPGIWMGNSLAGSKASRSAWATGSGRPRSGGR